MYQIQYVHVLFHALYIAVHAFLYIFGIVHTFVSFFPGAKIFRLHLHWCVHIWNGDKGIIENNLHIKITVTFFILWFFVTFNLSVIYIYFLDDWPRAASPPRLLLQRPVEYSRLYCGQRCPGGFCLLVSIHFFLDLSEHKLKGENPVCQLQSSKSTGLKMMKIRFDCWLSSGW